MRFPRFARFPGFPRFARFSGFSIFIVLAGASAAQGQPRAIDPEQSKVTVLVYKAGLFSAFADDHIINAPVAEGTVAEPVGVQLKIHSADLKVLDPKLSAKQRDEVQTRMLGPGVLDAPKFPDITFASTMVEAAGPDKWKVTGQLTIHGQSKSVTLDVAKQDGRYRGMVPIKQRDYGIEPISIVGGTVKVKDEIRIQFDIAVR